MNNIFLKISVQSLPEQSAFTTIQPSLQGVAVINIWPYILLYDIFCCFLNYTVSKNHSYCLISDLGLFNYSS